MGPEFRRDDYHIKRWPGLPDWVPFNFIGAPIVPYDGKVKFAEAESANWYSHTLRPGPTGREFWVQTKPLACKRKTYNYEGIHVEYLSPLPQFGNSQVSRENIESAEVDLRRQLVFEIEVGTTLHVGEPTSVSKQRAEELLKYFQKVDKTS